MLLNLSQSVRSRIQISRNLYVFRRLSGSRQLLQNTKTQEQEVASCKNERRTESRQVNMEAPPAPLSSEIYPTTSRVVPMVLAEREQIVLPFDEVPGPSSLKFLAKARDYLTGVGTQLTAGALTLGVNFGAYISNQRNSSLLTNLFNGYGPVVRFVSPVGGDIVLINHPDHIQKVFAAEGDQPIRSTLDSLQKFRIEHRANGYTGLYNVQGKDWLRTRNMVAEPLKATILHHMDGIEDVCQNFVNKVYNFRDCHDEFTKDLYKDVHKWAFDCMGYLIFSKKFTMLDTEIVYSQCDMSWLYHNLEKSTEAILKCESGLQLWKIMPTMSWKNLVKYCDSLDNLIGKHVLEAEQKLNFEDKTSENKGESLIKGLLLNEERLSAEDISTILMDMLLIGVNTISSSMSFLMYFLAKHQKVQKTLYQEIENNSSDYGSDVANITQNTPYLQACIKETLRLVPPIPTLTRVLSKNITLDKYNIPRGTLIIMSIQDASLKESNFDDALKFCPERWLKPEANEYHAFASIPFGFGARKCLGRNISEIMMSMLTQQMLRKFKLEYHFGDVMPTSSFIVRPNKPLKLRFIDRM